MEKITDKERMDYLSRHAMLYGDGKKVTGMMIKFPATGEWDSLRNAVDDAIKAARKEPQ
jgi:hypothetical protein